MEREDACTADANDAINVNDLPGHLKEMLQQDERKLFQEENRMKWLQHFQV